MAFSRNHALVIGLVVVSAGSLWRAVGVERDRNRLVNAHDRLRQDMHQMGQEQSRLTEELLEARQTIGEQAGALEGTQAHLERTMQELAMLQRQYEQLHHERLVLAGQLDQSVAAQRRLEARLSSIKELKLAIREVKRTLWRQRLALWRRRFDRFAFQRARDDGAVDRFASGNEGYVVRDGASTLGVSPRMHVHVLEPQSQ